MPAYSPLPQVLAPLGADTTGSRFLDPDGSFPNHVPNPEHPSAMASGAAAVRESGADLGIVFDTDVDRCVRLEMMGVGGQRQGGMCK